MARSNYLKSSEELFAISGRGFVVALLNLKITRGRAPYRDCIAALSILLWIAVSLQKPQS